MSSLTKDCRLRMIAALERSKVANLRWLPRTRHDPYMLPTPYGLLHVWAYMRGCWTVERNSVPLVQTESPLEAVFTSLAAAKATGLLHLRDGFRDSGPLDDGLQWKISLLNCASVLTLKNVPHFAGQSAGAGRT